MSGPATTVTIGAHTFERLLRATDQWERFLRGELTWPEYQAAKRLALGAAKSAPPSPRREEAD